MAASQKDNELTSSFGLVDTVTRTKVDLQLGHTVSKIAMRSGITVNEPIDPHLNARATCAILERINPVTIDLGHLRAHGHSVA